MRAIGPAQGRRGEGAGKGKHNQGTYIVVHHDGGGSCENPNMAWETFVGNILMPLLQTNSSTELVLREEDVGNCLQDVSI